MEPQFSAAASQKHPHCDPLFVNTYPGAQLAFATHWQPHVDWLQVWYAAQVPPQSGVHTKLQTCLLVSHTIPAGAVPPQFDGHSHKLVVLLQTSRPLQKSGSFGSKNWVSLMHGGGFPSGLALASTQYL